MVRNDRQPSLEPDGRLVDRKAERSDLPQRRLKIWLDRAVGSLFVVVGVKLMLSRDH